MMEETKNERKEETFIFAVYLTKLPLKQNPVKEWRRIINFGNM
jgi:hypothetical protein